MAPVLWLFQQILDMEVWAAVYTDNKNDFTVCFPNNPHKSIS